MNQEERLALAVRAHVARIRAEQAEERAALLERQMVPLYDAFERFVKLHRREPDLEDARDCRVVFATAAELGGSAISKEQVEAAAELCRETAAWNGRTVEALNELTDAMRATPGGATMTAINWVGCSEVEFDAALDRALEGTE